MTFIKILSKQTIVQNKWTNIVEEKFELENGYLGNYLIVERNPALMLIPITWEAGLPYTYLVSQYRQPINQYIWQFPMGAFDQSTNPLKNAELELRQETGLIAQDLQKVAEYYVDPGLSRQTCFVYIATNLLYNGQQELEPSEVGMGLKKVAVPDLEKILICNGVSDGWGYAGMFFLRKYLDEIK